MGTVTNSFYMSKDTRRNEVAKGKFPEDLLKYETGTVEIQNFTSEINQSMEKCHITYGHILTTNRTGISKHFVLNCRVTTVLHSPFVIKRSHGKIVKI